MSAVDDAKATLLRALEKLEQAEQDLGGQPERVDLVVIYELGLERNQAWEHIGGWAATAGPAWLHTAMLRRTANAHDTAAVAQDDEPDDDE